MNLNDTSNRFRSLGRWSPKCNDMVYDPVDGEYYCANLVDEVVDNLIDTAIRLEIRVEELEEQVALQQDML